MTTLTASTTNTLKSYNPATSELVGEVPITPVGEIANIVEQARKAQPAWRALSAAQRAAILMPAGAALVDRADEMGLLLTREMGKPLPEGAGEVRHCGEGLEKMLRGITDALEPDQLEDEKVSTTIYHDPFGVCAGITPWNFPILMPHETVIPAIMAGNTIVLKPSEETPLIAQAYVDLLNEFLPPDVLQIIHGADDQGKTLVQSEVDMIAFTGSRQTGKHILGSASAGLKRVILELGGKDPMVVLDDADVSAAAKFAVNNSFRNAGQVCVSTERIYVDEKIADEFEREVIKLAGEMKVGDGLEEDVKVGPMINAAQREHVLTQLRGAVDQGATIAFGGTDHPEHFVLPTVLTNVTHDMGIMCDETFGPVACIQRFCNTDEAIKLANDTPYGLGAAVFGSDQQRAADVARRMDAGMIGINKGCGGASGSPWVGAKQSGFGYHSGKQGHRQFTQPRVVSLPK